ncbi:hypothetical protein Q7P35_007274 [Cladosporium inversicolor]
MPPRKQKQIASASASTSSNENMTAVVPTKTGEEETHTPERSPEKRSVFGITESQKQALMDNLQLEVTERARKLRAQYALQAQGLRARLEMRVNRIPQALRKRNIQDLLDEYANNTKPKPAGPLAIMDSRHNAVAPSATRKSLKRTSEYFGADDKENADARAELPNPKKRTKTTNTVATADAKSAARPGSRLKTATTTVLSPKSHNQRVPLLSPIKSTFAGKPSSAPEKPSSSPAKPASQNPSTRAPSRQTTKRPATAMATSKKRDSEGSSTSAGTTIVTKSGSKKAAPARKAPVARPQSAAATTKRAAAVKKEPVAPATTAAGRTLRKRG